MAGGGASLMDAPFRVSQSDLEHCDENANNWSGGHDAAESDHELASCERELALGFLDEEECSEEEDNFEPGPYTDPLGVASLPFRERLLRATPAASVAASIAWAARLSAVDTTSALAPDSEPEASPVGSRRHRKAVGLNINSGGQVFFGLLAPQGGGSAEEAVVIKFCDSRHMLQSEQMSAELAWHLGVSAPQSRLLLKVHDAAEWQELAASAAAFCPELTEVMSRKQSMLLLQFVPGASMEGETAAWEKARLSASARALGRLLVLDLLLGNTDRLPLRSLGWRGNPSNILWGAAEGAADMCARCVPIDAAVARRPPRTLVQSTDVRVAELLEVMLLDRKVAQQTLLEAVSDNAAAAAAVEADWAPSEAAWAEAGLDLLPTVGCVPGGKRPQSAVKGFHEGVKAALELVAREQGLLEMVADAISSWFGTFRVDMRQVSSGPNEKRLDHGATLELKKFDKEAAKNHKVRNRLSFWQFLLQDKSRKLSQAAQDWAARRNLPVSFSFKGFLGDSVINPVADAYELLVRVQQLVARGKVMGVAAAVTKPADLGPGPLLVGGATTLGYHLLKSLGVTCIVNCTMDLPPPPEEAGWENLQWHRLALKDVEEQDCAAAWEEGLTILDGVREAGGRALVHCHEGKSRSVSLCLAYFMTREKRTLAEGLAFVKSRRPQARPNAGFLKQLLQLELATLGSNSMGLEDLPKGKPKMRSCDICGQAVGLTEESLAKHKLMKHPSG